MVATVALIQGDDRYNNVLVALDQIADQVTFDGRRQVLIKPNLVAHRQLAATHNDALRAVLDFVRARYAGSLIIAEGAAMFNTRKSFAHFGYEALTAPYNVKLVDLNTDDTVPVQVYDRRLRPKTLRLARTVIESDLRISVGPPKTHDTVIVTLSIKNLVMGTLVNTMMTSHNHPKPKRSPLSVTEEFTPHWLRYSALGDRMMTRTANHSPSDKFAASGTLRQQVTCYTKRPQCDKCT